jgi:hypothetical protein
MMRVLFGVFLQSCFFLAAVLLSMFVVLLQYPCGTLLRRTVKDLNLKIDHNAGPGAKEQVKRPAFLPST